MKRTQVNCMTGEVSEITLTAEEVAARKAGLSPPEAQPEIPTMVVRPEPEAPQEGRPVTSEDAMPEAHPGEDVGLAPAPEAPAVEPRAEAAPAAPGKGPTAPLWLQGWCTPCARMNR